MFCAPELVLLGTEGVGSRFHVLRVRTHFRRDGGCRVPFSCFALPDSFSAVPRVSGPFFMFCTLRLLFGGADCVGSRFLVLCARTRFRRYRGRRVPFSCFARPDSFSAVPWASGPFFRFYAPGIVFGGRVRRVPFSCFAHPDSFSAEPRSSGLVFMFCASGLFFGGAECVRSHFHVLCVLTHFWRYRGRRVPFSCFVLPESFSALPRASVPVVIFLLLDSFSAMPSASGSLFHVLRSQTRFRWCRGRRVPFSCFVCPNSFSAVPSASGPVFMFCASDSFSAVMSASGPVFMFCTPGLVFGGVECAQSRFHVFHSRTRFRP
jgi:hypothetical protein